MPTEKNWRLLWKIWCQRKHDRLDIRHAKIFKRLCDGENVYGDKSFEMSDEELDQMVEEEELDIEGWDFIKACKQVFQRGGNLPPGFGD